jgi:hypothetical protein
MLPKHLKYRDKYGAGETYWGFGVEHETYLESAVFLDVLRTDLKAYRRPERYSVSYYKSYKEDALEAAIDRLPPIVPLVPILLNSHSMTYTDISMNHRTTYESRPQQNPRYCGQSLHEAFYAASAWYRDAYDKWVVYDGDTFEFMNVGFYNASVEEALEELWEVEDRFVWEFNRFIMNPDVGSKYSSFGPYGITRSNYPFARHLSNPHHYTMFNNGTVHVNITLPTRLDASGCIADMDDFRGRHQRAARYFQWFEPLLAVEYGAGDVFSGVCDFPQEHYRDYVCQAGCDKDRQLFSPTSQRLALSRYIGMCTYDTERMPAGKLLLYDVSGAGAGAGGAVYKAPGIKYEGYTMDCSGSWYDGFYDKTAYMRLSQRGFDINYNKHWNHGLELRIFDGLRRDQMLAVCRLCWKLCVRGAELADVPDCRTAPWFQDFVHGCMLEGADYIVEWGVLRQFLEAIHYDGTSCELAGSFDEKEPVRVGELCAALLDDRQLGK